MTDTARPVLPQKAAVIGAGLMGTGIAEGVMGRIFEPYVTTKPKGTGLGLAIVHRIVRDHDGQISVHDNQPRGTRFEIELPA